MTTDHEQVIEQIAAAVPQVAQEHEQHMAARAAETQAEVAVLERVFAIVQPALRAISSRPKTIEKGLHGYGTHEEQFASWTGVYLGPNSPGPVHADGPRTASAGSLEGSDCYLCADGTLRALSFKGSWTCWEHHLEGWETSESTIAVADLLTEYRLDTILEALLTALTRQLNGNKPTMTKRIAERAAKLQAVAALIK